MPDEITDNVSELPTQEFTSCKDLALAIKVIEKMVKRTKETKLQYMVLKNAYILAEQFTYDPERTEEPMFVYAMTENPMQTIKIGLDKKIDNLKPLYKTFEYTTAVANTTELIGSKPVKVDLYIKLDISFSEQDGKTKTNFMLDRIEEKKEEEDSKKKEEVLNIIKEFPFLIGFVGIKKMIIPILFDSDAVFQEIRGLDYVTFTGKGFSQFLTRVEILGENSRQEVKVPVFITKPKMYVNMSSLDKDEITLMRAMSYQVDNYTFDNSTTFIPILFGDISKTISDLESSNQISELKMATYINSIMVNQYKEEIEKLISSNPLTIEDLKGISMTMEEIKSFTQIASMLIKDNYLFKKEDLQIMKSLFSIKTLLSDHKPFISDDIELLLSIIAFYNVAKEKNSEYKEGQAQSLHDTIKAIIDRQYQIPLIDFKNRFMKDYGITEKRFEELIIHTSDQTGYIEIKEVENGTGNKVENIVLTKAVESFLGE